MPNVMSIESTKSMQSNLFNYEKDIEGDQDD